MPKKTFTHEEAGSCINCGVLGDIGKCEETRCVTHDNWYVKELRRLMTKAAVALSELAKQRDN